MNQRASADASWSTGEAGSPGPTDPRHAYIMYALDRMLEGSPAVGGGHDDSGILKYTDCEALLDSVQLVSA